MFNSNRYFEIPQRKLIFYQTILEEFLNNQDILNELKKDAKSQGFFLLDNFEKYKVIGKDLLKNNYVMYTENPKALPEISILPINENDFSKIKKNIKPWLPEVIKYAICNKKPKLIMIVYEKRVYIENNELELKLIINLTKHSISLSINLFPDDSERYRFSLYNIKQSQQHNPLLEAEDSFLKNIKYPEKNVILNEINTLLFLLSKNSSDISKKVLDYCFFGRKINIDNESELREEYRLLYDNDLNLSSVMFKGGF